MGVLEREPQLRTVAAYLAEAGAGHGRLVFVAGEAGVGKSTFVRAFVADAGNAAHTAVGVCDGSPTPPPLGPLVELLPDLPADLWPAGAASYEVFTRLVAALRSPPTPLPYLLVIEDAHWADEATFDLLRHLARRIDTCRALVLVTYRPEDLPAGHDMRLLLGEVASAPGVRRLDIAPLSRAGVRALARQHESWRGADADIERLYRVSEGNPFFVTEVLAEDGAHVPTNVRDAVLARVARLSPAARRTVDLAALAGPRAELVLLDALLGADLAAIDEPLERGILGLSGGVVTFRHELARRAVASQIPAFRRRALHRRILAALTTPIDGVRVDPARLAQHADEAGDDLDVVTYGKQAAEQAAALGAHQQAVQQYQRVLRHARGLDDAGRARLLGQLGYECYLTGMVDAALVARAEQSRLLATLGDVLGRGDAERWLSRLEWVAGRSALAARHAAAAVELLEGTGSLELARAYGNLAHLRMLGGDLPGTRTWAARCRELLSRLPDNERRTEVEVHLLINLSTAESLGGDASAAERMLEDSLRRAMSAGLHEHVAQAYTNLTATAVVHREHAKAQAYLDAASAYCMERDLDTWWTYLQACRCELLLDRGETAAARACAEDVLRRPAVAPISLVQPLSVLARLRARAGDQRWREPLERVAAIAGTTRGLQRLAFLAAARCEAAWIAGDPEAASAEAERVWHLAADGESPWLRGMVATWLPPDTAVPGPPLAPPYELERAGRWTEAAEVWQRLGCPFERALALARSGDPDAVRRAVPLFEALGAEAAAARARLLLRARGLPAPRSPRAATRAHPDGLTERQAEVLSLLGQGLSNADIAVRLVVSPRTVEHHVTAILAKLGVQSRSQAVRAAGARDPG